MSHLDHFRDYARYNGWFNGRLYEAAAALSDDERKRDLGAFFRSAHGTLNHLLLTDRIWLWRFSQVDPAWSTFEGAALVETQGAHDRELFSDFAELTRERAETDGVIGAWMNELDADALERPMRYANSRGEVREHALWFGLAHFFNHQTHHRGQVTTLLSQLGRDPGPTDFLIAYYLPKD
jgi:uncharacterized damage-inducible protein DinB